MKKIVVLHANNTYNYGSFMMLINFIHYLYLMSNMEVSFLVELDSNDDLKRLKKELKNNIIVERFKITKKSKGNSLISKVKNLKIRIINHVNDILFSNLSALTILGGDDLSEYYSKWEIIVELNKIHRLSKKVPVFLVGQTIGPFHFWRENLAKIYLKNAHIYLRDSLCAEYLEKKLKLNDFFLSSDLAFLHLSNQTEDSSFYRQYNLKSNDYIILVPSGSFMQYTNKKEIYVSSWVEIVHQILNNPKLRNKKIVLLAHVLKPQEVDDRLIINDIRSLLSEKELQRIVVINEELLPSEARDIIGNGLFTITGRMHAAISSFQMSKPAISLSYSVKYEGIIGKDLDMKDLIVCARGNNHWESGNVVKETLVKISFILNHYEMLTNKIEKNVGRLKELSITQINDIYAKI
ncbi:Polysaccharide pyruvyl transferase [uncultured archaeon]|nr:Polysaccharide pyruvyl transferase [uncultured archaeon]